MSISLQNPLNEASGTPVVCLIFQIFTSFATEVPIIKKQSTDIQCKLMDWFLYDRDLRREIINK